jgi:hypothetical protein
MDLAASALGSARRLDPVEGWRAWRLVRLPDGGFGLGSLFSPQERWRPRAATRAVCAAEAPYHLAPAEGCRCGYYAYAGPGRLAGASRRASVIGAVALWGSVIAHDFGYRAEYAYPQRLRLVCGRCLRIGRDRAARWVVGPNEALAAVCARHAPRVRRRSSRISADRVAVALRAAYAVEVLPSTGLVAPPWYVRARKALVSFLGAKTSFGWLLLAVLVASGAFWAAGRSRSAPRTAPRVTVGEMGAGTMGAADSAEHPDHGYDPPSAGVVLRETCGAGPAGAIRAVPCSAEHRWTSNAIFRAGILPRCFGAVVQARPNGRTLCWVPVDPRAP